MVHAFGGKDVVEYDNPYDVGMTGLIGFSSGYRAMEHCDALVMLGTDFPYRPFFPRVFPSSRSTSGGSGSGGGCRCGSRWWARSRTRSTRCCP